MANDLPISMIIPKNPLKSLLTSNFAHNTADDAQGQDNFRLQIYLENKK